MMICDFCSGLPVVAAYPCRDFALDGLPIGSQGAWAACAECARLIDGDQRDALAWRTWRMADRSLFLGHTPPLSARGIPEEQGVASIRALHALFFAHRDGEPVPVGIN